MKRIILFLFLFILFLFFKCPRKINEIGNNSIYFKINGKPVVAYRDGLDSKIFNVVNNKLLLIPSWGVEMYIDNFHGEGRYVIDGINSRAVYHDVYHSYTYGSYFYFKDTLGNLGINSNYDTTHVYNRIISPSYVHILDYNPNQYKFQVIFEYHVADSLGDEMHITKGRIIWGYQ